MTDTASSEATTEAQAEPNEMIMTITDEALVKVFEVRSEEDDPTELGLRVEITGSEGVDFTYDLAFETLADAKDTDTIYTIPANPAGLDAADSGPADASAAAASTADLSVIVPENTIENLRGATLDLPSNPMQGGLVIRNPNRPPLLGDADIELHGSIEDKVKTLLERQINPSLAVHGGYAQLERVEGTVVYVTMGGGCQGCSMSAITLRDGITQMIGQMVPEVTDVIDTTEHEAGENPYFE